MKKIGLLVFIMTFGMIHVGLCLDSAHRYPREYMNVDLAKQIKLSDWQIAKINKIRQENEAKMNVLQMKIETLRFEQRNIAQSANEQIREILNDKQKAKYDKLHIQYNKEKHIHDMPIEKPSRKKMPRY